MKKQKKETLFARDSYDETFADFAVRLDNDLGILKAIAVNLRVAAFGFNKGLQTKKSILACVDHSTLGLEKLGERLLESAKRLPFANEYYYGRQDLRPGDVFGIDDRKALLGGDEGSEP